MYSRCEVFKYDMYVYGIIGGYTCKTYNAHTLRTNYKMYFIVALVIFDSVNNK